MIQLVETCFLQSPLKPRVLPKEAAHEITTLSHLQAVLMCLFLENQRGAILLTMGELNLALRWHGTLEGLGEICLAPRPQSAPHIPHCLPCRSQDLGRPYLISS